jgi:hypothetical protein
LALTATSLGGTRHRRSIIAHAAFDAIAVTMPVGSVGYEAEGHREGQVHIWLEERWLNKLTALRQPGEGYSILRAAT